jgi:hypothetical protein
MNRLIIGGAIIAALGLTAGCGGGPQQTRAYQVRIESAGELVAGQASACLSQIRSYWAVAEYAKAADMDFDSAAREMQTGQTRENLRTMGEMKARIDGLMEGLQEPPEEFADALPLLEDLYAAYVKIHEFALKPTGDMGKLAETIAAMEGDLFEKKAALDRSLAAVVVR